MPAPRPTPAPTDRAALEVAILASELGAAPSRERPTTATPPASATPPTAPPPTTPTS